MKFFIVLIALIAVANLCTAQKTSGGSQLHQNIENLSIEVNNAVAPLAEFLNKIHTVGNNNSAATFDMLLNYTNVDNSTCLADLELLQKDAEENRLYALKILDSWAKPHSGILEGDVRWPGSFYECRNAKGSNFSGQYYTIFYGVRFMPSQLTVPIDIAIGTCWPSSCDSDTVAKLLPAWFPKLSLLKSADSDLEKSLNSPGTIIAIIVSLIFALMAVLGTSYHIYSNHHQIEKNKRNKIMMCWSALENVSKICSTKEIPGSIPTLDGIRTISTTWVILGHTYYFIGSNVENAISMGNSLTQSFLYMIVLNGTFSVDTFFCLSGLLICYLTLKQLRRPQGKLYVPMMYLKRYLRLTPLYAYLILFSVGLYKFFGDGPYWKRTAIRTQERCQEYWWANLLYTTTLYPINNECFGWGWYLSNDTMFFLISPLIAFAFKFSMFIGLSLALAILFTNVGLVAWLTDKHELIPSPISAPQAFRYRFRFVLDETPQTWEEQLQQDIYHLPWCRIGAYMVGMIAGYILYKGKLKVKMPKIIVALGWLISTCFAMLLVYGLYGYTRDMEFMAKNLNILYNSTSRSVWSACVAWVVIACSSGYGGPVTTLLELKIFRPLSRLTYAAYLVHPLVSFWYTGTMEKPVHFSNTVLAWQYFGLVSTSFMIAFVVAVFVEWPMQEMCKLALPKRRSADSGKNLKEPAVNSVNVGAESNMQMSDLWNNTPHLETKSSKESSINMENNTYENEAFERVKVEHSDANDHLTSF